MRKALLIFSLLWSVQGIHSQDSARLLDTFKRNFAIASLDVKLQIIQDAAKASGAEMGPLYLQAIDFVLDNSAFIHADIRFRQLGMIALAEVTRIEYVEARHALWKLFEADEETTMRVAVMNAMSVLVQDDNEIVEMMNGWLQTQNAVFATGTIPDLQVIAACIQSLGKIGVPSSFPIVFSAMTLGYSDGITNLSRQALLGMPGDFTESLLGILEGSPLAEKKVALIMALASDKLDDDEKGEIAEYALTMALRTTARDVLEREATREMRYLAVAALSERKWSKATEFVIEHFNATLAEYERGVSGKSFVLEAIATLGNMGAHEAAVRLTQYLVLLNSYTEKGRGYDEQIVLAVLSNIGKLGDKVSFDDLMYTQYLNYSNTVKKEAKKAAESISW